MFFITVLIFGVEGSILSNSSDLIKQARIQFCGCKYAYTQSLCELLDDCRWKDLQCMNITGIPQVITINENTSKKPDENDENSNSSNNNGVEDAEQPRKNEYEFTADFDYDSVSVLDSPVLTLEDLQQTKQPNESKNAGTNESQEDPANSQDAPSPELPFQNGEDIEKNSTQEKNNQNPNNDLQNGVDDQESSIPNTTTIIQEKSITWQKVYLNKTFDNKVKCSQQTDENNCNKKRWPNQLFCLWKNNTCGDAKCSDLDATVCDETFFCINYGFCTSCLPQVNYDILWTIFALILLI